MTLETGNRQITALKAPIVDDQQRVDRLSQSLRGTGATINGPFSVWAQHATITDAHLHELSDWADLEHLVLSGCPITDDALPAIFRFQRLKSLDLGETRVTSSGILSVVPPASIRDLGLSRIYLTDEAVDHIAALPRLRSLNCNGCGLSINGLFRFVAVPGLRSLEALGCHVHDNVVEDLSRLTPDVLMRLDSGVWKAGEVRS